MIGEIPHPFLLVHIPKTAGTSIENALVPVACEGRRLGDLTPNELTRHGLPGGERVSSGGPYRARGRVVQHEGVEYFEDFGQLDGREIISVVRNPYDRALSEILYLLRTLPAAGQVFCGPTWADDLKTLAAYDGYLAHDLSACQVDWLSDRKGRLRCHRLMRFETLGADWKKLCEDWGIGWIPLPHSHDSGRVIPWWEYYDEEAAEAIAWKYARDFELLGYDTSLPRTDDATKRKRSLWLGACPAPDGSMLVAPKLPQHGRMEFPDRSCGIVHLHGAMERSRAEAGSELLGKCRNLLVDGGQLTVHVLDLKFLCGLLVHGYEAGSLEDQFVKAYADEFLPKGSRHSPAAILADVFLHKGFATLYDEERLADVMASAGLVDLLVDASAPGELRMTGTSLAEC